MQAAATELGRGTDFAFLAITGACVILLAIIVFFLLLFVIRYRSARAPVAHDIESSPALEISFLGLSLAVVLAMFALGWDGYASLRAPAPEGSLEVRVTGQMWLWSFSYPGGASSSELVLPSGRPVKLAMGSRDVLHSIFVPAFRIKQDLVPGADNSLWFVPDEQGSYDLFCAEYCGTGHSAMITRVVVLSSAEFDSWLKGSLELEPAGAPPGEGLYRSKGCSACHSIDGSRGVGPTFKGLYGSRVRVVSGGKAREVVADDEYLRRSELEPAAEIVEGFAPVMPSQEGVLSEEEIGALIEYIKGLR